LDGFDKGGFDVEGITTGLLLFVFGGLIITGGL